MQRWYEEYHPFGSTAWWAGVATILVSRKRYRYTGMERDEETGLQCHGRRYFAPWLGRWTSADPIGVSDGVNRYAYVQLNPAGGRDANGLTGTPGADEIAAARRAFVARQVQPGLVFGPNLTKEHAQYTAQSIQAATKGLPNLELGAYEALGQQNVYVEPLDPGELGRTTASIRLVNLNTYVLFSPENFDGQRSGLTFGSIAIHEAGHAGHGEFGLPISAHLSPQEGREYGFEMALSARNDDGLRVGEVVKIWQGETEPGFQESFSTTFVAALALLAITDHKSGTVARLIGKDGEALLAGIRPADAQELLAGLAYRRPETLDPRLTRLQSWLGEHVAGNMGPRSVDLVQNAFASGAIDAWHTDAGVPK